jgi:hypothetical protein
MKHVQIQIEEKPEGIQTKWRAVPKNCSLQGCCMSGLVTVVGLTAEQRCTYCAGDKTVRNRKGRIEVGCNHVGQ